MTLIKRFIAFFALAFVLLIGAALIMILSFDLNTLKPKIEELAAAQNMQLRMRGDITWSLWPTLALDLGETSLNSNKNEALASIHSISLRVAIAPLLKKQLEVDAVELVGLNLNYHVDEKGHSAWQDIASTNNTSETATKTTDNSSEFTFAAKELRIRDSVFSYSDATSELSAKLNLDQFILSNIGLDGRAIGFETRGQVDTSALAKQASFDATGEMSIEQKSERYSSLLKQLTIQAGTAQIQAQAEASIQQQNVELLKLSLNSNDLQNLLIELGFLSKDQLPAHAAKQFHSDIVISNNLQSISATAKLDNTDINMALQLSEQSPKTAVTLKVGRINLENYISNTASSNAESTTAEEKTATPLPLKMLRSLDGKFDLHIEEILWQQQKAAKLQSNITARDGIIKLKTFNLLLNNSPITVTGQANAQTNKLKTNVDANIHKLQLSPLLKTFADIEQISGAFDLNLHAESSGATDQELLEQLNAKIQGSSEQLQLSPINIVRSLCEGVAALQGKSLPQQNWDTFSIFDKTKFDATLANGTLELTQFNAGINELRAAANGSYQLANGKFDLPMHLRLDKAARVVEACAELSDSWHDQVLPLRCKGQLEKLGPTSCGLDKDWLKQKAKANFEREKDKQVDKAEEKLGKETEKLLKKHLDDDDINKLKSLLKK